MAEPEVVDLQLTIDTLRTQVRDAQRIMTELRTELDARRQELADAQVARAQLEGRVREAERRVAEARHVIDLQREELVAARTERERISRSSLQLQGQMKRLQKHLSRSGFPPEGAPEAAPATREGSPRKAQKAAMATPAALVGVPWAEGTSEDARNVPGAPARAVSVKPGDTLWSISKRYRVGLNQLRSTNHLTGNIIEVGQTIWVPTDRTGRTAAPENAGTAP